MPNIFPRVFTDSYQRSVEIGFTRNPREVYIRFREGSDPTYGTFWTPEMSRVVGQSIIDAGKVLGVNEVSTSLSLPQIELIQRALKVYRHEVNPPQEERDMIDAINAQFPQ